MSEERASLSGVVVCLVAALVSVAGLTFDGGRVVSTYSHLASIAATTARLGAQEITGIQDGDIHIDAQSASSIMNDFLRRHRLRGDFVIGEKTISVTVARSVPMRLFGLLSLSSRHVSATRAVEILQG